MRRILLIVAAVASLAALTGCGENELSHGNVTSKEYQAPRDYMIMMPIYAGQNCVKIGTSQSCSPRYNYMPMWQHDGADYILHLQDGKNKGVAYVSEAVYNTAVVGKYFDTEKTTGASSSDKNNVQTKTKQDG